MPEFILHRESHSCDEEQSLSVFESDTKENTMSEIKQNSPSASEASGSSWFVKGLKTGIPICLGYFAVSVALGITCRNAGLNALQSGIMSATMLASAGEFAAVTLIQGGAGILEMITTTLVVNLRYFLMGCALSQKLRPGTKIWHRFLLAYCVTDELFGVSVSVDGYLDPRYTYGAALTSAIGWTAGTVVGVLIGTILPPSLVNALSVALYGMFLAVIIPASRKSLTIGVIVAISMAASFLFSRAPGLRNISSGFRVIILTLLIAGCAAFLRPVDEETE